MSITSSGGFLFDVCIDLMNTFVVNSYAFSDGIPPVAQGVSGVAGLVAGLPASPLAPGTYYIHIYGRSPATVGTWTLKITS